MTLNQQDITKIFQELTENCWSCSDKHPDELPAMVAEDKVTCNVCSGIRLVPTEAGAELLGFLRTFAPLQRS